MTLPTHMTWSAGIWSAADMNKEMRDALVFYLRPPMCIVRKDNSPQRIASTSGITSFGSQQVTWDTVVHDSDAIFNSSQSTRLTANTPGYYHITLQMQWIQPDTSINAHRGQYLDRYNAAGVKVETAATYRNVSLATDESHTASVVMQMSQGDYIIAVADLFYTNNDELAQRDSATSRYGCQLEMRWLSTL
ncbi:hypothetical protein [Nonomuraea sp. NPDC002799]